MYILECADESYYIGSTKDLDKRIVEHQNGRGANYTKNRLPVKLVYVEEFNRIDKAFEREKQIQKWTRAKKEALVKNNTELLHGLSECKNESHYRNAPGNSFALGTAALDSAQAAGNLAQAADNSAQATGDFVVKDTAAFDSAQAADNSESASEISDLETESVL